MDLIDAQQFLEKTVNKFLEEKEITQRDWTQEEGILLQDKKIFLQPHKPTTQTFFHKGQPVNEGYNNVENIKKGYFGHDGWMYVSTDKIVKPSHPEYDIIFTINTENWRPEMYKDPESLLKNFEYEYGKAYMFKGPIPKKAITSVEFPTHMRFVPSLRPDGPLDFKEYFSHLANLRAQLLSELLSDS